MRVGIDALHEPFNAVLESAGGASVARALSLVAPDA
jgi:hypothetical protein